MPLLTFVLAGCLVALGTLHLGRSLGRWYGRFASMMLAVSETEVDLALARQEAATQGARAERLEQGRRELVMNISHDLRTPIASIQGHVAAMLENESAPEESRRYLAVVARESDRLGTLVEDLLLLARSDVGELQLDLRPVDVAGVVREVAAALTPIARRDRRIAFTCSVADPVPAAQADAERLTQVLMNLARNAIVYTPEGGIVSIEAAAHGTRQVAIVVADTGVGIPPEDVERIFERFVRGDASRSRATGGFGLGLAIARDLVAAMGGTVAVRSEPRQGSRFTVLLRRA
jgi:signal transduction histidine kinase